MAETRVEKFKKYRDEIAASFPSNDDSTMKKTSDRVDKVLAENKDSTSIPYDDLLDAYELYDKGEHEEISPLLWLHKKRRNYVIIVSIILTILSITALISGILYFGGK